jgi:MoaA/NifB/PqqE/SkfB family radical SAM enzyme
LADAAGLPTTVRTLFTQKNMNEIEPIGHLLSSYSCVDKWSLRQFAPLGRGAKTRRAYAVSNDVFFRETKTVLATIRSIQPSYRIKIVSETDLADCFCLIAEDGVFYSHPKDGTYKSFGRFPDEPIEGILERMNYKKSDGYESDATNYA